MHTERLFEIYPIEEDATRTAEGRARLLESRSMRCHLSAAGHKIEGGPTRRRTTL